MNDRIKELAEQAKIKFESHPQHQGIDTAVIIPTDLEKFAELLLKECAGLVAGVPTDTMGYHTADQKIKQHFGVKE